MREDILIVDGYNVIFAWPELKKISKSSLEHARGRIKHMLQNYGKHKGYRVILVFDGKYAHPGSAEEFMTDDFLEVYTADGETADSYIERTVFTFRNSYANVYVCTSDYAEQSQVLGFGALRISARELKAQVERAKIDEQRYYKGLHNRDSLQLQRNELGYQIDGEVAKQWEILRRGKK